jgi:hypothetical protein
MPMRDTPTLLPAVPVMICIVGLILALVGSWMIWGPASILLVLGAALFVFGLASIG